MTRNWDRTIEKISYPRGDFIILNCSHEFGVCKKKNRLIILKKENVFIYFTFWIPKKYTNFVGLRKSRDVFIIRLAPNLKITFYNIANTDLYIGFFFIPSLSHVTVSISL